MKRILSFLMLLSALSLFATTNDSIAATHPVLHSHRRIVDTNRTSGQTGYSAPLAPSHPTVAANGSGIRTIVLSNGLLLTPSIDHPVAAYETVYGPGTTVVLEPRTVTVVGQQDTTGILGTNAAPFMSANPYYHDYKAGSQDLTVGGFSVTRDPHSDRFDLIKPHNMPVPVMFGTSDHRGVDQTQSSGVSPRASSVPTDFGDYMWTGSAPRERVLIQVPTTPPQATIIRER